MHAVLLNFLANLTSELTEEEIEEQLARVNDIFEK